MPNDYLPSLVNEIRSEINQMRREISEIQKETAVFGKSLERLNEILIDHYKSHNEQIVNSALQKQEDTRLFYIRTGVICTIAGTVAGVLVKVL